MVESSGGDPGASVDGAGKGVGVGTGVVPGGPLLGAAPPALEKEGHTHGPESAPLGVQSGGGGRSFDSEVGRERGVDLQTEGSIHDYGIYRKGGALLDGAGVAATLNEGVLRY